MLKQTRKALGLTQEEMARALDVTMRTIGNWERSEIPPLYVFYAYQGIYQSLKRDN